MTQDQYTLAELLDLQRQFKVYGTLVYCPADHAHEDDELNYEVVPTHAISVAQLKELNSECKVCGREMHAYYDGTAGHKTRPEQSLLASYSHSMQQHFLRMTLAGSVTKLQKERARAQALMQEMSRIKLSYRRNPRRRRRASPFRLRRFRRLVAIVPLASRTNFGRCFFRHL